MQFNPEKPQMIPQFPDNFAQLNVFDEHHTEHKIQASQLELLKLKWTYMVINQTLISIKDEYIRQRYFNFMKKNKIEIVSDIFERMDLDRKFRDELRKVQNEQQKKGDTV